VADPDLNIRTILVPTDFSASAAKAQTLAAQLAKHFGAKLVLLHAYHLEIPMMSPVMVGGPVLPPGFYDQIRDSATEQVEELAAKLRTSGLEIDAIAISEPASIAIVDAAERLPADLIVMGTRGNTGVKHVLLGSVAERVLRMAPCPVLTVKGEE